MQKIDLLDEAIRYHQNGNFAKAEKIYRKIIKKNKKTPDAWHLLGLIDYQKNKFSESIQKIETALSFNPYIASFYSNLGLAYFAIKQIDKGIQNYQQALKLRPNYPEAFNNLGNALSAKGEIENAIIQYKKAIELNPSYPEALCNLANAYFALEKDDEALYFYQSSLSINPNYANSYAGIALLMKKLKKYTEAIQYFEKALSLPGLTNHFILSDYYEIKRKLCSWDNIDEIEQRVIKSALSNEYNSTIVEPFNVIGMLRKIDAKQQRFLIEKYVKNEIEPISQKIDTKLFQNRQRHDRIKIAYISPNFYEQASMHLVSGIFDKHDTKSFELYIYALYYDKESYYYKKVKNDAEHFVDLKGLSSFEVIEKIREDEIDILIDLRSHGKKSKAEITASKAAPIQVSFINFAGTTGNKGVDYIIVDKNIVLKEDLPSYSEQAVFMPDCCMVTDDTQPIADQIPFIKEQEVLEKSFVFCCFNTLYKIEPDIFNVWMNILKRVDNSVLWLLKSNDIGEMNLRNEAEKRGIDPKRIIFADIIDKAEHLARMKFADLFLDTYYCNAHTTAIDSLWAGVPLITIYGKTYASRVASSILRTADLEELVCNNFKEYEEKAVFLLKKPKNLLK